MEYIKTIELTKLAEGSHMTVKVKGKPVALFHYQGKITALGNSCLHKGGPLGEGFIQKLNDGKMYVACPWHGWQYQLETGQAPAGFEDRQAVFDVKVEDGYIFVAEKPRVTAHKAVHKIDPLADLRELKYETSPDSLNILGISTTNLNPDLPRTSTSESALEWTLDYAAKEHKAATKLIKLRELMFRHCEGYYSRHQSACTWPCSISEMNPDDGMNEVYRAMVLWADIVIIATPIRWGNPSSLYFKMVERLNCVQNQITLNDRILIKNKVGGLIVTGGQDNIQQVAGQFSAFFTDLGFSFPPFNFVGWSRGWLAEDMENNVKQFQKSRYMKRATKELINNSVRLVKQIKHMDSEHMKSPKPGMKDIRK